MSDIGPMSVNPFFPWRIISCPAANGMEVSKVVPIATEAPSTTHREMASAMLVSFEVVTLTDPFVMPDYRTECG
jgi:hypothetical protein